jgi:membrane protease YdiL (CAAX protease family)
LRWSLAAASQLPLFFLVGWVLLSLSTGEANIGVFGKHPGSPVAMLAVLFAFDMIFGGALGEEIGWRGFALPVLLRDSKPLGAALVLGVVWSLWHLPIDLAGGFGAAGIAGVIFRLLFTGSLSVIVTWYFIRSGHGLLTAFLIHTTINWLPVLEFSNYETAIGLLFIMMFLFAMTVGLGDKNMRGPRGPFA